MTSRKKKILFASIPAALVLVVAYLGYAVYRSKLYYNDVKSAPQWNPRLFHADEEMGYASVPNYRGALVVDRTYRVPAFHDEAGFRVDPSDLERGAVKRPVLLTLGDSFSYGFGIEAKETYAHLVAEAIGGSSKNAGGNGYGLAQMLILARRRIPEVKPDYVLVQYSPWVTARGMHPFAPTGFVAVPVPYFYESDGKLNLARPVFGVKEHDLPIAEYCETGQSPGDFISFFLRVGIPLRVHDDSHLLLYRCRKAMGLIPAPTKNPFWLENHFYREVATICRENGAQMVIVAIGNWEGKTPFYKDVLPEGVIGVRSDLAMIEALEEISARAFVDKYAVRWGDHVNLHHNAVGNRIIAKSVLEGIETLRRETPAQGAAGAP